MNNPFFDALNSIGQKKLYWLSKEREKDYNPFGINLGLSQHIDAILHVNEMNMWWQVVSKHMHYDYLFNTVRAMRRPPKKWAKMTKTDDEDLIMKEYGVNRKRAREYITLMDDNAIEQLRKSREVGTT